MPVRPPALFIGLRRQDTVGDPYDPVIMHPGPVRVVLTGPDIDKFFKAFIVEKRAIIINKLGDLFFIPVIRIFVSQGKKQRPMGMIQAGIDQTGRPDNQSLWGKRHFL